MIYIHVPFCHRKCTYCAFFSKPVAHPSALSGTSPSSGEELLSQYVDALIEEMRQRRHEQTHPIRTIYFGGGTPSILAISDLERIVKALHENFDLSQVEEVTLEANPEDLTEDYLHGLRGLGLINRLSIGIQSLDDDMLRLIGRRHTSAQALAAVEKAHTGGFSNLSVDFIYGLPVSSQFSIFNFQLVSHVSAYALTVEPGTALAVQVEQGRVVLPGEDEVVRQYEALCKLLGEKGFEQYEVSNFCRPGMASKHNSRYWDRTPYLGLGPGAHSFSRCDDVERRRWNNSNSEEYCKVLKDFKDPRDLKVLYQQETLTEADAYNELLMTALRTTRGLPLSQVPEVHKERLHRGMQPYMRCGWIVLKDGCYRPTAEGLLHADGMAAALFL